jgi:NADH dehydrogenase FAD-containing subunit
MPRVVIVGAGFGSLQAARALRDAPVSIIAIDRQRITTCSSRCCTGSPRLVARGLSDAQVAQILVNSPRTVNAHLRSIYSKLNITSRHAATLFAIKQQLI